MYQHPPTPDAFARSSSCIQQMTYKAYKALGIWGRLCVCVCACGCMCVRVPPKRKRPFKGESSSLNQPTFSSLLKAPLLKKNQLPQGIPRSSTPFIPTKKKKKTPTTHHLSLPDYLPTLPSSPHRISPTRWYCCQQIPHLGFANKIIP